MQKQVSPTAYRKASEREETRRVESPIGSDLATRLLGLSDKGGGKTGRAQAGR